MSGFGGGDGSDLEGVLKAKGVKTLLFAGVNADQVRAWVVDRGLSLTLWGGSAC